MKNEWRPVKGYEGKYEVSYYGEVRRVLKKGYHMLTPFPKNTGKAIYYVVKLTDNNGKASAVKVSRITYEAFIGPIPKGGCILHRNRSARCNEVPNLCLTTHEVLGKELAKWGKKKPVLKLDRDGNPVEVYRSAREAGNRNFMSGQAIRNHCMKKDIAPDGFIYIWDDEYDYAA